MSIQYTGPEFVVRTPGGCPGERAFGWEWHPCADESAVKKLVIEVVGKGWALSQIKVYKDTRATLSIAVGGLGGDS